MATILLKRGKAAGISGLTLAEGEAAVAYSEDKNTAQLYVGGTGGKPILVTADVAGAVQNALEQAREYTDTTVTAKLNDLVNGAPATLDTLKEIADEINKNKSAADALNSAIGSKLDANSTIDGGTF